MTESAGSGSGSSRVPRVRRPQPALEPLPPPRHARPGHALAPLAPDRPVALRPQPPGDRGGDRSARRPLAPAAAGGPRPVALPGGVRAPPRGRRELVLVGLSFPRSPGGWCPGRPPRYLSFAAFLRPFDGPLGRYDADAQRQLAGREVRVPFDFVGKEERYRFLLPGAPVGGTARPRHGSPAMGECAPVSRGAPGPVAGRCRPRRPSPRPAARPPRPPDRARAAGRPPRERLAALFLREQLVEAPRVDGSPRMPRRRVVRPDLRDLLVLVVLLVAVAAGFGEPSSARRPHVRAALRHGASAGPPVPDPLRHHPARPPHPRRVSGRALRRPRARLLVRRQPRGRAGRRDPHRRLRSGGRVGRRDNRRHCRRHPGVAPPLRPEGRQPGRGPHADGTLWLFYVTVSVGGWGGSTVSAVTPATTGRRGAGAAPGQLPLPQPPHPRPGRALPVRRRHDRAARLSEPRRPPSASCCAWTRRARWSTQRLLGDDRTTPSRSFSSAARRGPGALPQLGTGAALGPSAPPPAMPGGPGLRPSACLAESGRRTVGGRVAGRARSWWC